MLEVAQFYEKYNYPYVSNYCLGRTTKNGQNIYHVPENSPINREGMFLVVGCGTIEACMIAKVNPNAEVLGIDLSKNSLKIARSIKRNYKINNLTLLQADITEFDEGEYDIVFANCCLHHIPEVDKAVKNIHKVMKYMGDFRGTVYTDKRPSIIRELNKYFIDNNFTVDGVKKYFRDLSTNMIANHWFKKHVQHNEEIADTWLNPYWVNYSNDDIKDLVFRNGFKCVALEKLREDDNLTKQSFIALNHKVEEKKDDEEAANRYDIFIYDYWKLAS